MQNKRFNVAIAFTFAFTVLFIPVGDAFAQTQIPIFGDYNVAVIDDGSGELKVAPEQLKHDLEETYGGTASTMTFSTLVCSMNSAGSGDTLVLEGGYAVGDAVDVLESKGYVVETSVTPRCTGAAVAYTYSD